jgi:hypothetical protein
MKGLSGGVPIFHCAGAWASLICSSEVDASRICTACDDDIFGAHECGRSDVPEHSGNGSERGRLFYGPERGLATELRGQRKEAGKRQWLFVSWNFSFQLLNNTVIHAFADATSSKIGFFTCSSRKNPRVTR